MLAVVKKPHTEIELHGKGTTEVLRFLREKFVIEVVKSTDTSVAIRETDWWKRNKHRVLAGFRHKLNITQKELSERSGICQSVISEYEIGKRPITLKAATRLAKHLKTTPVQLLNQ